MYAALFKNIRMYRFYSSNPQGHRPGHRGPLAGHHGAVLGAGREAPAFRVAGPAAALLGAGAGQAGADPGDLPRFTHLLCSGEGGEGGGGGYLFGGASAVKSSVFSLIARPL